MSAKAFLCPCGGADYAACCGRYHDGIPAPDTESLMRSRYSAYALKLEAYLLATWHHDTCPGALDVAGGTTKWSGLEIRKCILESANRGTVEFVARYKIAGRAYRLHEISRFMREEGRWFYVGGEFPVEHRR